MIDDSQDTTSGDQVLPPREARIEHDMLAGRPHKRAEDPVERRPR
jgi:hypothetical protein